MSDQLNPQVLTPNAATAATQPSNAHAPTAAQVPDYSKDDAEFREIATQRFMYKADECKETPLVGFLLNLLPMAPMKMSDGEMRDWSAFLIRTTRPVYAFNRDKLRELVPVGSEVLIPATYELQQFVTKAATAEGVVFEIRIQPSKKISLGGVQKMWLYSLAAKPLPKPRKEFGLTAVIAPHQLPAPARPNQPEVFEPGTEIPF